MKISISKTEVLHLSRNLVQRSLQVGRVSLKQSENQVSRGLNSRVIETKTTSSITQSATMRALHHSVVSRSLSQCSSPTSPMVMSLNNDQKGAIANASVRNRDFAKK